MTKDGSGSGQVVRSIEDSMDVASGLVQGVDVHAEFPTFGIDENEITFPDVVTMAFAETFSEGSYRNFVTFR